MDSPLISIAMPVHNTARFLPAALDSLLAQDHVNWECLLWDDGSSDGCDLIAATYAQRDARIKVLGNGRNNGVCAALAGAFEHAGGEYLGVLDSDDMLEPDTLSTMLAFMQAHPSLGMAYSQYIEIDTDGNVLGPGKLCLKPYSPKQLLVEFMTYHFRLIRADAFRAAGGIDPAMPVAPDYDLCLRLSEVCQIGHLAKPLYRYRIRHGSISRGSRLKQVQASFDAAQRALQRRKLATHYALSLGVRARHVLKPKPAAPASP